MASAAMDGPYSRRRLSVREIGMLRSIGARGRDVRRIFATEGLALALAGWLLGIPLGYPLARGIGSLAGDSVGLD